MKFIVDFVDDATPEQIAEYFQQHGCQLLQTFSAFDKCYLVEAAEHPATNHSAITSVMKDEDFQIMPLVYSPTDVANVNVSSDDDWWKVVSIAYLDVTEPTINVPRRGDKANVYVVDSGVNSNHPEFQDAIINHLYSFNDDFKDYNGHGTAIASVINGKTCGLTSSKVTSVKIFQSGVPTYQSHMLAALDAIYNDIVANPNQFPIVNLSWAIAKNEYIESKIKKLIDKNVWVVCSAGNSGIAVADVTPAGMPETYTISSFSRELKPCDFTNYESAIANTPGTINIGPYWMWAPGEHIRVAFNDAYDYVAGTSISAAIASAAMAYSTWVYLKEDGSTPQFVIATPNNAMSRAISNGDLLDIPIEYSQGKPQLIAGFPVYKYGETMVMYLPANQYKINVKSNQKWDLQIVDPMYATGLISIDPLPDGIVLNGNYLEGQIETDTYFVRRINYSVRLNDGEEYKCILFLYVTADTYTPEMIPEEDQILDIALLLNQCCITVYDGCLSGTKCALCFNCADKNYPQCVNRCSYPCYSQECY